ncbi:cytochrome P450 [Podospora australis]|uniref:Cytochrome P450 n=1 Tax=Podospora australis TaxID=1536484 RepID=A0AAN7ADH6_9PEZI|nr:cytochrome P450 [Podospora australis]
MALGNPLPLLVPSLLAALPLAALASVLLWASWSACCLYRNYQEALTLNVPIRIIPIDHLNKLWLLVDRQVVAFIRRILPARWKDNNFTRYNYRGWHEKDGIRAHEELGEAFVLVTPARNWFYLADPEALLNMYKRGKDFPRWVQITQMLDVFGGPNIATASREQWRTHRKIVNNCLNESCNAIVWQEAKSLGEAMASYWARKEVFTSVGEDTRTATLHVLTKACYGQSLPFEGADEVDPRDTSESANLRKSLVTVMENALLILALRPSFFTNPWLPLPESWKNLGKSCNTFKAYMKGLYTQKLQTLHRDGHLARDPTLMASLISASQKKGSIWEDGLTEDEIYGTMFVFTFAGHDTTAHLLAYSMFFLSVNPHIQAWLAEELDLVLGDRPTSEWDYHKDYPRMKRCLAILYETLRVKTLVCEVKWTDESYQQLDINGRTVVVPPKTLIIPSYWYVHNHEKYWGPDSREWKPQRWIGSASHSTPVSSAADFSTEKNNPTTMGANVEDEILLPPPSRGNYLGWSEGSRDCPGKKFSQVEWVAFMATMFRDYKVEPRLEHPGESPEQARGRVLDYIEKDSDYGGLLLQLMHPERIPLVWTRRVKA